MEVSRIEICPEDHPTGERWDPLGAPNDQEEEKSVDRPEFEYCDNQSNFVYVKSSTPLSKIKRIYLSHWKNSPFEEFLT
jgi:hypothetical protein